MALLDIDMPHWLEGWALATISAFAALIVHWLVFSIAVAAVRRRMGTAADAVQRFRQPTRWLIVALSLAGTAPFLSLTEEGQELISLVSRMAFAVLIGWLAMAFLATVTDIASSRADISAADNLRARRRRTRIGILRSIASVIIIFTTLCWVLMAVPSIRNVGVTLIASAGLAALAVGAAAQPALKNLVAGMQMAFTEPIRIDDVVVVAGEWGRVEEIRLTYVVLRLWDERRLVVPVSNFLEQNFENWTRITSQITGSVIWQLDPATNVGLLREKLGQLITQSPLWDGRQFNLQVTGMGPDAIEVRAVVTARNASEAFDLRCWVREEMLTFIRSDMPAALVRQRTQIEAHQEFRAT